MFDEMSEAWDQKDFVRLAGLELKMWVDGPGQQESRVAAALRERVRGMILDTYTRTRRKGSRSALILRQQSDSRKSRRRRWSSLEISMNPAFWPQRIN
jgi:hypothetical protein